VMALLAALAAAIAVATAESIPATARLARRLAAWAACRRYAADPGRAARRAQEWQALISDRPGRRVLGLLTAARFALLATWHATGTQRVQPAGTAGPRLVGPVWDAEQAVTAIYWTHYRPLVRLAALLLRDAATAENVVQDSFVAMHGAWGRLGDADKALSFLRQSVVTRSRSVLRHRVAVDRNAPMPAPDLQGAEQGSMAELERSAVVMALWALPARQREAIVLKYYADLSETQIAAAMGISRGAVKSHTARAITALRAVQRVHRQNVVTAVRR
jgi:RNA polymerase sigma-70 factor (sigma-E family)